MGGESEGNTDFGMGGKYTRTEREKEVRDSGDAKTR